MCRERVHGGYATFSYFVCGEVTIEPFTPREGTARVARGGECRPAFRYLVVPDDRNYMCGFRVARNGDKRAQVNPVVADFGDTTRVFVSGSPNRQNIPEIIAVLWCGCFSRVFFKRHRVLQGARAAGAAVLQCVRHERRHALQAMGIVAQVVAHPGIMPQRVAWRYRLAEASCS